MLVFFLCILGYNDSVGVFDMDNRITAIKELVMQSCERLRAAGISVDESTA